MAFRYLWLTAGLGKSEDEDNDQSIAYDTITSFVLWNWAKPWKILVRMAGAGFEHTCVPILPLQNLRRYHLDNENWFLNFIQI